MDPDLFLSFARLGAGGDPSEERILRWVRRHGLLMRRDPERLIRRLADGEINQAQMTARDFRAEVREVYGALTLLEQIRARNHEALEARIRRERVPTKVRVMRDPDSTRGAQEWRTVRRSRVFLDERPVPWEASVSGDAATDALEQATRGLQSVVEQKMDGIRLGFTHDFNHPRPLSTVLGDLPYRPRLVPRCRDLLSALWFQFAALMADQRPLRNCEECGLPFVGRKSKRTCTDACRTRKSRRLRASIRDGYSTFG